MRTILKRISCLLSLLMILEAGSTAFVFADAEGEAYGSDDVEAATEQEETSIPQEEETPSEVVSSADENEQNTETDGETEPEKEEGDAPYQGETDPSSLENGEPDGWREIDGKKYYYSGGTYVTGMQEIEGSWYYFNSKGEMHTGWLTLDGEKYYFNLTNGKRKTGKEKIDGGVYYFSDDGTMVKGWLKNAGKKFYHSTKTGKRLFGSKKIGKYKYYFALKSGAMKTGWLKLKGKKYYYNKKGRKLFGMQKIGGKVYYLNRRTGARMPKGSYYLYNKIWTKSSDTSWLVYVDKGGRWVSVFKGSARHWTLKKRFRCSIGAKSTPTPSGTYRVTCKVNHFGEGKGYTCWYATGFIGSTYLIHSVVCYKGTKTVSDGRLGKAISHGCVRMKLSNAKWLYDTVPTGSKVFIK